MTAKHLLPSSFSHFFGSSAVSSLRNKVFFINKGVLPCQIVKYLHNRKRLKRVLGQWPERSLV